MEELKLTLKDDKTSYRPGEEVVGRAQWSFLKRQKKISISLYWHTTGKGTEDSEVVEEIELDGSELAGYKDFSFILPNSPYSFSGRLLSIVWCLELAGNKDAVSKEIVVSPGGQEICVASGLDDSRHDRGRKGIAGLFGRFKGNVDYNS